MRLTGLGSIAFESSKSKFQEVMSKLHGVEAVRELEPLSFGGYEGHFCIDLHTRYLTERRFVSGQATIPFTEDIDPRQVLEEARGGKFVRVRDNVVQYGRNVECGDGKLRCVAIA